MKESKDKASIYFQNGCRLMDTNEFEDAIKEFEKSISLVPSFDSYQKKYECLTKLDAYKKESSFHKKRIKEKIKEKIQETRQEKKVISYFVENLKEFEKNSDVKVQNPPRLQNNFDKNKKVSDRYPITSLDNGEVIRKRFKQIYSDFNEMHDYFKLEESEDFFPDSSEIRSIIVQIENLIDLIPSKGSTSESLKLLDIAIEKKGKGEVQVALDHLTELINKNPSFAVAFLERAKIKRYSLNDLNGANDDFKKYLDLEPNDNNACFEYADVLGYLDRFEESIFYYKKAIKIISSDRKQKDLYLWGYIHRCIAEDEVCLYRFDDAIASLKKAVETTLKNPYESSYDEVVDIFEEIVLIHIRDRKNIKDAISSLEEIIQIRHKAKDEEYFIHSYDDQDENEEFYFTGRELNLIAYCEYKLENYEKVLLNLSQTIDVYPNLPSYGESQYLKFILNTNYILRGQAYLKLGKTKDAYNDWNKIDSRNFNDIEIYERQLSGFFEENNFSECKKYLSLEKYE
tara:strand:- start:31 stop:1572 length:1542 start_codon:yes stop_codon:yes gene_type:complete